MAVINGSPAGEPLNGTAGNDTITGGGGADTITMLGGSDLALWSFGDGSDIVEGGAGNDTARFSSTGGVFIVAASGSGKVFVADGVGAGAEIATLNDVERLELFVSAFYNTVRVDDLSGTDVTKVTVNFAGANDLVAATASAANNTLSVTTAGKNANITGLPTIFTITNADASDVVEVHGAGGNDKLDGSKLALGRLHLSLSGDDGNDFITGSVNDDGLYGGDGNDTVIGGRGNDAVFLGAGDDLFLWNVLDGFDTIDGEGGFDTVRITGSNADEGFSIHGLDEVERVEIRTLGGADFISVNKLTGTGILGVAIDLAATVGGKTADTKVDTVDLGPNNGDDNYVVTSIGTKIFVSGLGGELSIDHAGKTDILRITGGLGNDTIDASALAAGKMTLELLGNSNNDTIIGSAGNDRVTEAGGDDIVSLGAGNDFIDWSNGNGDDAIDGGSGFDRLLLGGNGIVSIGGFAGHALLGRNDGASIIIDGVERIEVAAPSGAPSFTVGDISGTGVQQVAIDLGDFTGKTGNGFTDVLRATGSAGNNMIGASLTGGVISVSGLAESFTIAHAESSDQLVLAGAGGNDIIDPSKIAGAIRTGVDGGSGTDTLRFTGLAADETFSIDQITLGQFGILRDVGGVTINGGDIERIELNTLGGADTIKIGDPSPVGVTEVAVDLAATAGGKTADTKVDTILADGTSGGDNILLAMVGSKIVRTGLPLQVSIDHAGKTDRLVIHANNGNDFIDASIIPAAKISFQLFGDDGDDFIWSSAGDDAVQGGTGDDLAILGAGNDVFDWFSGDGNDRVEGQAGTDTVNASFTSASDTVEIAADGDRVRLQASSEGALLDIDDVERFKIQAAGGADTILVHDLTGTDTKLVSIDLGTSFSPTGDGQGDIVNIDGGAAGETITVSLVAGAISIKGLAYQMSIAHSETIDALTINGLGGNDSISAAALPTKSGHLTLDGGAGNDKLTGNLGDNTLLGGDGNDTVTGGGGNDEITGGLGNDTITGGTGSDIVRYTSVLDGHDVIVGFDGNAAGGQDVLDLDALFDNLLVGTADRAGRVSIVDKGATVEIAVDTDGNATFDLAVATLKTADMITVGQDIAVGTM